MTAMKLGQLADLLRDLADAEREVEEAKSSLEHGGSESTVAAKRESLGRAQLWVEHLRDQELPL